MSIPVDKKTTLLKQFYTYLYDKDWRFMESTEKDKVVLEEFQVVRTGEGGTSVVYIINILMDF